MKARLLFLPFAFLALLGFSAVSARAQTVVTFDDLHETASGSFITAPYQGLVWSNYLCLNSILANAMFGTDGTYYGMVSASNVVINGNFPGTLAEIDSLGASFNFLSVYLTGEQRSNLNVEVQGFSGANLLYDTTVIASATNPTLFTFNYLNIDRLYFNSFGGEPAFFGGEESFVMDNFSFEFVPEPSSLLLTTAGVLTFCAFLKRKRA